jgi:hypothetical protein
MLLSSSRACLGVLEREPRDTPARLPIPPPGHAVILASARPTARTAFQLTIQSPHGAGWVRERCGFAVKSRLCQKSDVCLKGPEWIGEGVQSRPLRLTMPGPRINAGHVVEFLGRPEDVLVNPLGDFFAPNRVGAIAHATKRSRRRHDDGCRRIVSALERCQHGECERRGRYPDPT